MKMRSTLLVQLAALLALGVATSPVRADDAGTGRLSPERIDMLVDDGVLSPAFQSAARELIDAKQDIRDANAQQKKLENELPGLQDQVRKAQAQADALRQELAKYDHPDENDFAALQAAMNDPNAKPEDQLELAQAYVWTYGMSPHLAEAQQNLQMVQKKISDALQAQKDADATKAAAHAKLVERAEAHDLSLLEWRDFLRDMSQADLLKYIGRPTFRRDDYWVYSGGWINDPSSNEKAGMEINFNGGRVLSVNKAPPSATGQ